MHKQYALSLFILLAAFLGVPGAVVSQQQQFIIGGDWIRQPPIASSAEQVPRSWWEFARQAGLEYAFVYTNEENQQDHLEHNQLELARVTGMKAVTGFFESPVPQDYMRFIAGRRWRYHPEDSIRYPRLPSPVGEAFSDVPSAAAEQDASVAIEVIP